MMHVALAVMIWLLSSKSFTINRYAVKAFRQNGITTRNFGYSNQFTDGKISVESLHKNLHTASFATEYFHPLIPSSALFASGGPRRRFGLTSDDLNGPSGSQGRKYKQLDGYEDDVESMAMNYTPDYDNESEDENNKSQSVISTSQAQSFSGTHTNSVKDEESPKESGFQPTDDNDDDAEPLSPLSHFSAIAEPTYIKPVKPSRFGQRPSPPPRSSWQTQQRQQQPSREEKQIVEESNIVENNKSPRMSNSDEGSSRATKVNPMPAPAPSSSPPPLSREEWRAKYSFLEDSRSTSTSENPQRQRSEDQRIRRIPSPSQSSSSKEEDLKLEYSVRMEKLKKDIFTMHGSKFNLKSYKQVSQALFGSPDQSTAKEVLEGMAGSNILAKLILEYRQVSQQLSKLEKRISSKDTRVKSIVSNSRSSAAPGEGDTMNSSARLFLLDTSSFIFRAYYSMPPLHRASDGLPCGAVMGFCNMLNKLLLNSMLDGKQPRVILCNDAGGGTFRNDLYDEYKANRPEAPIDLLPQFDLIYEAAEAYGIVQVKAPGYEADDVIATLSQQALAQGLSVDILSGDKDLMQLITNSTSDYVGRINMIDPMTMSRMTHDTVIEKWGVPSHQLGDLLALAGDTADNIPGVPGIGPKIAAQLLQEYTTLEEVLRRSDEIKQVKRRENLQKYADQARLSQALVELVTDVPQECFEVTPKEVATKELHEIKMERMDPDRILEFYDSMGFYTIKKRLLERLDRQEQLTYQRDKYRQKPKPKPRPTSQTRSYSGRKGKKVDPPKPEDYEGVPF